jgi:uncharacterized protein
MSPIIMIIIAIIICYLAVVIFHPALKIQLPEIARVVKDKKIPQCRQDITFYADDIKISAWLYFPEGMKEPVPCVILNNGFGGTKDMVLEQYALKFVENGIAAIAYDYRYFGESGGEPRQFFNGIKRQEDLKAAVAYARSHQSINADKIILWCTSAGSGYGINVASEDHQIAGVIAQCPSLDHKKDDKLILQREGLGFFLKLFMHAQRDKGRSRFGFTSHMLPIVGKPGTFAFMTAPGAFEGYTGLAQESEHFINGICARSLLMLQGKNPKDTAKDVKCPVLLLICEKDNTVSPDTYKSVADTLGEKATVLKYPVGHFDIYHGEHFKNAVAAQVKFIKSLI